MSVTGSKSTAKFQVRRDSDWWNSKDESQIWFKIKLQTNILIRYR